MVQGDRTASLSIQATKRLLNCQSSVHVQGVSTSAIPPEWHNIVNGVWTHRVGRRGIYREKNLVLNVMSEFPPPVIT